MKYATKNITFTRPQLFIIENIVSVLLKYLTPKRTHAHANIVWQRSEIF